MTLPGDVAWLRYITEHPVPLEDETATRRHGFAAGWDARRIFDDDRRDLVLRIAHDLENQASRYTRAYGREDNSKRVLELTDGDVYEFGQRLRVIMAEGIDPGDSRYVCGYMRCSKHQGHSGTHDEASDQGGNDT